MGLSWRNQSANNQSAPVYNQSATVMKQKKRRRFSLVGDFKESDMEYPELAKKFYNIVNAELQKYKKSTKLQLNQICRLKVKLRNEVLFCSDAPLEI
jgi:hypothetical protein